MKKYSKSFISGLDETRVSVYVTIENDVKSVNLSIDNGVSGHGTALKNKEIDELILMLKEAKKKTS